MQNLAEKLHTNKTKIAQLERLNIHSVRDLLMHLPRGYSDDREVSLISNLEQDKKQTIKGRLSNLFGRRTQNGKHLTRAVLTDEAGDMIEILWFNQPHLVRMLRNGLELIITGKPVYKGRWQIMSPIYEEVKLEQIHAERIVPVYSETEGINSKWLREKIKPLINDYINLIEDYLPEQVKESQKLIDLKDAIKNIHFPKNDDLLKKARHRLAFDELFLLQLKVLKKKYDWQNINRGQSKKIVIDKKLAEEFVNSLPFELTNAQKRTIKEIVRDLESDLPMCRLVQGDVGSGKTVVAAFISLLLIKNGYQVAVMAPTTILAKQHLKTMIKFLSNYGVNTQFIAGLTTKKQKEEIITQMKTGTTDLVVGTHALIQEKIGFKNLGLAIIDEQHRFGVKQRSTLKSHGNPHLLSLSATPIPRTLAMTVYGDQDLSIIDEMPKGRQEIITRIVPEKKRIDAYRWIEEQVKMGRQAFIICPLIEESTSETMADIKAVTVEYDRLCTDIFPHLKVGLLHGKLSNQEKEEVMKEFSDNKYNILVATSVVEVGIDVPNASIMIIEGAERFGLSQLHQFRGRVGRGEHQSYCFLFPSKSTTEGQKRLKAMTNHTSGFKLAEIDMELRGPGEVYGVKQSGIPDMKMASLSDSIMINQARTEAQKLIDEDGSLEKWPVILSKLQEAQEVYTHD